MEIICPTCNKIFKIKPNKIRAINYCSNECRRKGKYINCLHCNKSFYVSAKSKKKFCCAKCGHTWRSQNMIGEQAANYKGTGRYKCAICNNDFISYSKNPKYCSVLCKNKSLIKDRILKMCEYCKKEIWLCPSVVKWQALRGYKNFFCCKKCEFDYKVAENHPRWISDRSLVKDQYKSIRWSKEMCDWRKMVYERDKYICQMCFKKGIYLNAHHIKKFADYPNIRFDINNGITLCKDCHQKTKGKEDIFEQQFMERIAK